MQPFPDSKVLIGTFDRLKINAAVFGQDGTEWASSPDLKITKDEALGVVSVFEKKDKTSKVEIAGTSYTIENLDDVSFSGTGNTSNGDMFAVRKTHNAIVVACWGEGGPTLVRGAEKIDNAADFMMNEGF